VASVTVRARSGGDRQRACSCRRGDLPRPHQSVPGSDDRDDDGIGEIDDVCADTPPVAVVGPTSGCSSAQLVPCAGPLGSTDPWTSHGE
jgi:hypothetical protein